MMKWLTLVFIFYSIAVHGQSNTSTIAWLNARFANSPILKSNTGSQTWSLKISNDGSFTILNYDYPPKLVPGPANHILKKQFTGHFKDLQPAIRSARYGDYIFFYGSCIQPNCIQQQTVEKKDTASYTISEILLGVSSAVNLEERIKKEFTELVEFYRKEE